MADTGRFRRAFGFDEAVFWWCAPGDVARGGGQAVVYSLWRM